MPGSAPQAQPTAIARSTGGVLPISAVNTQNANVTGAAPKAAPKPAARLKVVVRRLPPGLTKPEFEQILGEEWQAGRGKVAWALYRPGKVSKDIAKPSKAARAYLQVTQLSHLDALVEKIRNSTFIDAAKSNNDPVLLGPPVLEFAPYGRVPFGRKRNDARQGLIDQDAEFIQFLESLTSPVAKPAPAESTEASQAKDEAMKVTPLIQHLRDKKAAKEAAREKDKSKASKHNRQSSKPDGAENGAVAVSSNTKQAATDKKNTRPGKAERTAKISKPTKKDGVSATALSPTPPQSPKPKPAKRADTANPATAAARMLQRDLGIKGGRGGSVRKPTRGAAANGTTVVNGTTSATFATEDLPADSSVKEDDMINTQSANSNTAILKREPQKPVQAGKNVSGPGPKTVDKPATGASQRSIKQIVNPTSTQAFLKHANPSQGVTEPLLEEAFATFGAVTKVEIDKRKGFAYIDFATPEGLQKAIAASPVKVAQGSVQVLERKERGVPNMSMRGGGVRGGPTEINGGFRGGRAMRGGRGGSVRGAMSLASSVQPAVITGTPAGESGTLATVQPTASTNSASGNITPAMSQEAPLKDAAQSRDTVAAPASNDLVPRPAEVLTAGDG